MYSEAGKRSFGKVTCLAVTETIVLGTSKGLILVFDQQENSKAVIGAGTKAAESGAVTSLAISADQSTVAVGHAAGHIFTWEVSRPSRPFLHILPDDNSQAQGRKGDGHVSGAAILHIGFLGYRHTALATADDRGMAFSHLATRGMGPVGRAVRSTRILGRYPELVRRSQKPPKQSSVLAFAPLPLGNVERATDNMGLVAMMTPYLLVIVSTTTVAQTQHKAARSKEIAEHSAMSAALAWFPSIRVKSKTSEISNTKLVYCWSNVLTILEVHEAIQPEPAEKERPPELQFSVRNRYQTEEAIVAVQWISRSVLGILTITQQLLILEDVDMHVNDSFDLLPKNLYHPDLYSQQLASLIETLDEEDTSMHGVVADAFHMSFRAYKGRLYILGQDEVSWGSLTNWADRLLAMMAAGDFIGAINLATSYLTGSGEKATIGLPEDDEMRAVIIRERLIEMMTASLKYAFGQNENAGELDERDRRLSDLAAACIKASIKIHDLDFLFEDVFAWYEEYKEVSAFLDVLEPYIMEGTIESLPPPVIKALVEAFAVTRPAARLEEIICLLDTSSMDIDQVTTLCKRYNLYDAYIYVWNKALRDYTTPLIELLAMVEDKGHANGEARRFESLNDPYKIFPYLSFSLTSRVYPTAAEMTEDDAIEAKTQIYAFFFLDHGFQRSRELSTEVLNSKSRKFARLHQILSFDAPSFISVLNEAFEDSFLNLTASNEMENGWSKSNDRTAAASRTFNRQFIVHVMLEVMSSPNFSSKDTIYFDMFIARNLAKYPQYLLLSGTTLQEILSRLCRYPDEDMRSEAQLSVEYLLSVYHPPDLLSFVPQFQRAKFFRVLQFVFRQEKMYLQYVSVYLQNEEDQLEIYDAIRNVLRPTTEMTPKQRDDILDFLQSQMQRLLDIDIANTAHLLQEVAPDLHYLALRVEDDPALQFEYLQALFRSDGVSPRGDMSQAKLLELHVCLMSRYQPEHVPGYLRSLADVDLSLEKVVPALEQYGIIDATVTLLANQGELQKAMQRLVAHLENLKMSMKGLLDTKPSTDEDHEEESIMTGVASIKKYVELGIWLCTTYTKSITTKSPQATRVTHPAMSASSDLSFGDMLWVDLMSATISFTTELSKSTSHHRDEVIDALRTLIQRLFTALLGTTTASRIAAKDANTVSFLRILRGFLTNAAAVAPSLSALRAVLVSIFSAYAYEESLLALANTMLDKDVFVYVDEVNVLRKQGWRPRGQICEICRRRVWGPGIGAYIWDAWQEREEDRRIRRLHVDASPEGDLSVGKGKGAAEAPKGRHDSSTSIGDFTNLGPVITFSCRHIYHLQCLNASQGTEKSVELPDKLICPACA